MSNDRVIGGYTLRRVLGRGGMGEVHLAVTPAGGLAAVKLIRPDLVRDPAFRRRFDREVAAARRVARFCTAPVLDAGIDDGVAYLVTEYVKGPDLAQAVRDQGPLTGSNLEALAVGIATALGAIHGAGVIHRDLKPSNVLLSPLGPRVIDFGIAQLVGTDSLLSQSILGTPAFMAPEQVRGEPLTPAADVHAWGGVIAFAGTGRLPFGGGAPAEVLYRIVNEGPRIEGLDEGMRDVVERATAKDPRLRPTAQQLLETLMGGRHLTPSTATRLVEHTWTTPHPAPTPHPGPSLRPGPDSRHETGRRLDRTPRTGVRAAPASLPEPASDARPGPHSHPERPQPPASVSGPRGGKRRRWLWGAGALLVAGTVGALAVLAPWADGWPYQAGFGSWAAGSSQGGDARITGSSYVLTGNAGWRLWKSAPRSEPVGGVVVSARARIEQGTGEYGVWCHGSAGTGDRYEFSVRGSGQVAIVKRRSGKDATPLYGPADAKAAPGDRIVAECSGSASRAVLRMWLGERLVAEAADASAPYGPGETGVLVAPGAREPLRVRFDSFTIARAKG